MSEALSDQPFCAKNDNDEDVANKTKSGQGHQHVHLLPKAEESDVKSHLVGLGVKMFILLQTEFVHRCI